LGAALLSPQQLAGWYVTTGSKPRLAGITIDELASIFVDEGEAEGVRGDVAFAQAYLETGGFAHGSVDNNFAGLGACDSCSDERRFPTPRDGVRAQIQHLRNYADKQSRASELRNPPSPWWYGQDPGIAARNFDTFFAKGWAPTWQLMGHGNWATDPDYATKVLGLYQRMIAYAQQYPKKPGIVATPK
jgi:Mannosyl-glycoprotein endo-beta-N-acetylglucosaminidase